MNGFEKRAEQLKARIRTVVLEMLQTCEPKNIRIADIAAEAGVSQVTIYNYFSSKEELIRDVFKQFYWGKVEEFERFIEAQPTFKQFVEYVILEDKEAFRKFTPAAIQEMMRSDEEISRDIDEIYRTKGLPLVTKLIEGYKQKGEISDKVSTTTILAYINMFNAQSRMLLEQAEQSGQGDVFFEEFIHLFFYGICGIEPSL
jgi:AcrR family transcriptional regulator